MASLSIKCVTLLHYFSLDYSVAVWSVEDFQCTLSIGETPNVVMMLKDNYVLTIKHILLDILFIYISNVIPFPESPIPKETP